LQVNPGGVLAGAGQLPCVKLLDGQHWVFELKSELPLGQAWHWVAPMGLDPVGQLAMQSAGFDG
jgi:hypothetical protein